MSEVAAVDQLLRMDDDTFTEYVVHRVDRDVPDDVWAPLYDPIVIGRTRAALNTLSLEFNTESGEKRSALTLDEYKRWKQSVSDYREAIDLRVRFLAKARRAVHERAQDIRNRADRQAARTLAIAIADHRIACAVAGIEPEEHDRTLWDLLDQMVVPHREEMRTLSQMLAERHWTREDSSQRDVGQDGMVSKAVSP